MPSYWEQYPTSRSEQPYSWELRKKIVKTWMLRTWGHQPSSHQKEVFQLPSLVLHPEKILSCSFPVGFQACKQQHENFVYLWVVCSQLSPLVRQGSRLFYHQAGSRASLAFDSPRGKSGFREWSCWLNGLNLAPLPVSDSELTCRTARQPVRLEPLKPFSSSVHPPTCGVCWSVIRTPRIGSIFTTQWIELMWKEPWNRKISLYETLPFTQL